MTVPADGLLAAPSLTSHSLPHPQALQNQPGDLKKILTRLSSLESSDNVLFDMEGDSRGIADRIPLSDDGGLVRLLSDIGPSCTSSVETFQGVLREVAGGKLTEANVAHLIYFFSQQQDDKTMGMSSSLLGSLLPGQSTLGNSGGWNLEVAARVLREDYSDKVDWAMVAKRWDFPGFALKDVQQFRVMLDLFRAGCQNVPPLSAITSQWTNTTGQLSIIEAILAVQPSVYAVQLDEEEQMDAATASPSCMLPNPLAWASLPILRRLLSLSDVPALYRRVRDLFVKCLLQCPEVLLCSLVRMQLRVASLGATQGNEMLNAGLNLKQEVMRELIPLFFRPNAHHRIQNGPAALRRLYAISAPTVVAACLEAWRSTSNDPPAARSQAIMHIVNIARLLPSPTEAVGSLLSAKDIEFSLAMAFVMADHDYLQLKVWLGEKMTKGPVLQVASALMMWLRKNYTSASNRATEPPPLVSLENIVTSMQLLRELDASHLNQSLSDGRTLGSAISALQDAMMQTFPSLRAALAGGKSSSEDVEEMATQYFQRIYTSEQSIGEVVEMLKRFKSSGNSRENEIFACMVHNLFDEYRFFSKYPDKELRITGILFGALIQEQLVSSITLGIALRYVLEALRKPPSPPGTATSSGKMFKFGMFALEQFKGRLHEWPQYCSHIVQIPHLREGYAELVSEIEREMTRGQGRPTRSAASPAGPQQVAPPAQQPVSGRTSPAESSGSSLGGPSVPPVVSNRKAEFGPNLGRAVTDSTDQDVDYEAPPDAILDRVQFMINNMAPSNVEEKAQELKRLLDPKYFGWLGHFLVVKRISTQANFHGLYLSFLDHLGDYGKGLISAILSSAYHNIGKLLRSSKITTSSSERSYLKNLGIWLGQITLARNRPILQIMLDCKELLLQGYETGKLIAVAPFLAKTLEGAKKSVVFRPPNPWLMAILGVFRAVYNVEGLKMNIKFEVEVLCKNLGIKLEDIPLRNDVLRSRIAPTKERNPDFNVKAPQAKAASRGPTPTDMPFSPRGSSDDSAKEQTETVIPNLASYVTVNPNLSQLLQSQGSSALSNLSTSSLKRWVPIAVDKAIREIIQPVVERSVTIACITTKEIVTKDFAMESDETKLRKAGQLMVANLAGSLALVTCREPLRSSISQHLRRLLTDSIPGGKLNDQEQNAIEQCVQICATDNLELGCMLIEKAATEKAVKDVEEGLSGPVSERRTRREQTGQPFYDMSIFSSGQRYPTALPEQLQPKPGGLRAEHFQLYENFQRLSRQTQNIGAPTPQGSGAPLLSSRSVSASSAASDADSIQSAKSNSSQQLSMDTLNQLASKLDSAVVHLLSVAGARAPEVKLSMISPDHQIRQLLGAVKKIVPNANSSGGMSRALLPNEQELMLAFSQGIFKRLYELSLGEPLRLEVLVALLEEINKFCPKLGKDLGTWATYAPTNTEPQRRLHRTVLLLLLRSHLLTVPDLDSFLAARTDNGRNAIWVEFSLLFLRTAFVERISIPAEFPKLMDLMARIADGRSHASPQVIQTYRKPILRMLEETGARVTPEQAHVPAIPPETRAKSLTHEESSSLSLAYLTKLKGTAHFIADVTQSFFDKDPSNAKQQVTALIDAWIRLQNDPSNGKGLTQFLQVIQQFGVGKDEEQTERFLRLSALVVVEAVLKTGTQGSDGSLRLNHTFIDLHCKLLVILFRHMNKGGSQEQVQAQRLGVLNRILGSLVRTMMWHSEKSKAAGSSWDQRPWYRIFLNLLIDLNKPDPAFEPISLGILSVFGAAFHTCQPLVVPRFAFAWLELVSHRHFMPNLLLSDGKKGWNILHQLLMDHFLFLQPCLARVELTPSFKKLYEGTLRVLLVILHDFPSFFAGYHVSFCNVIPDNCVQLRNIILSATPKGMNPPDPFTPNLKIDLLSEVSRNPVILSNVLGPIESFRAPLDAYLKDARQNDFPSRMIPLLKRAGTNDLDVSKVQSLIIYVGAHALARMQNSQISLSRTAEMEVIEKLMELDDRDRYICLNTIANQLRYPSSHTHYFSCVMLYLFSESKNMAVKEQVTRVLLERLIVNRPHPWGLLITFIELIKNQRYAFWSHSFVRCAAEIEKVFESVARSAMQPGVQRGTLVGGEDHQ